MRQLSKEECGVISGGISTTNLPTNFVNAPPPPNGVYIPSSGTGSSQRGASPGNGGGHVTIHENAKGQVTSVDISCPAGTNPAVTTGSGALGGGAKTAWKVVGLDAIISGSGLSAGCRK